MQLILQKSKSPSKPTCTFVFITSVAKALARLSFQQFLLNLSNRLHSLRSKFTMLKAKSRFYRSSCFLHIFGSFQQGILAVSPVSSCHTGIVFDLCLCLLFFHCCSSILRPTMTFFLVQLFLFCLSDIIIHWIFWIFPTALICFFWLALRAWHAQKWYTRRQVMVNLLPHFLQVFWVWWVLGGINKKTIIFGRLGLTRSKSSVELFVSWLFWCLFWPPLIRSGRKSVVISQKISTYHSLKRKSYYQNLISVKMILESCIKSNRSFSLLIT